MKYEIEGYLPEFTKIIKTPDLDCTYLENNHQIIKCETVTLRTKDVIDSFLRLQQKAIEEVSRIKNERLKRQAIARIRTMVHFEI